MIDTNLIPVISGFLGAIFGATIGAIATYFSVKKQILANFGSRQMQDYNAIMELEQKILDCGIEKEKETSEDLKKIYDVKIETLNLQYRNIFEILCDRYLTKSIKIDKENFKEMYRGYIVNLVKNYKMEYGANSKYKMTIKVYNEFKETKFNKFKKGRAKYFKMILGVLERLRLRRTGCASQGSKCEQSHKSA